MGNCCCFHAGELEEYANPNNPVYQHCLCLRCLVQNCLSGYTVLFQRGEGHDPPAIENATSFTSTTSQDNMLSDMYNSPPRPLPYDADPRCFHLHRGGLVSRREKGSSHLHEESEPLRQSDSDTELEQPSCGVKKCCGSAEGGSKKYLYDLPQNSPFSKQASSEFDYYYSSSDEEDVCPTCLEEYTTENPKIMTKCSHHYHLGCIYEWMERSESCPVCGKVMEFDETP